VRQLVIKSVHHYLMHGVTMKFKEVYYVYNILSYTYVHWLVLATISSCSVHGYGSSKFSSDAFVCDTRNLLEVLLARKVICIIVSPTDRDTW